MLGILVAGTVGAIVGAICSSARDMHSDNLISSKELAEIEAKSKAFTQLLDYHKNTIDKAYRLEKRWMEMQKFYIDNIGEMLNRIDKIEDQTKLGIYINQIAFLQNEIQKSGTYFNENVVSRNNPQLADFHNRTQIGENSTKYEATPAFPQKSPMIGNNKVAKLTMQNKKR